MALSQVDLAFLLTLIVAIYVLARRFRWNAGLRLPPGPKQLPIVGNYFDVPTNREWLTYADWGKRFGMC
jgi:hypothetical protein